MTASSPARRSHERSWHTVVAHLTTEDGRLLQGHTRDLSVRGVCLHVAEIPKDLPVGTHGTLRLQLPGMETQAFTCQVVYIRPGHIGIHVVKFSENFGNLLSQALFAETHPVHKESVDWRLVQARIHKVVTDPSQEEEPLQGNVLRLTSDWVELCCLPAPHAPWRVGAAVMVQLTAEHLHGYHCEMKGFLVDPIRMFAPKTGCSSPSLIKKVAFASDADANIDRLVGLMRVVHAPKMAAVLKERALSNALLAGEEAPPPTQEERKAQLRRFFTRWFPS
ncbi:MAG: PilZ domain-containing protein [Magnetococcales bacterium]|nr:PilZ domain-containing protein [Magnetococcales bacterium]